MSSVKKTYILKLYVAGNTPNSIRALKTLNNILEEDFQGGICPESHRRLEKSSTGRRGQDPGDSHPLKNLTAPRA